MDFYGVEVRLCRFYRAQTKGKVESGVKYVKRNALAGRRFRDLEELNGGFWNGRRASPTSASMAPRTSGRRDASHARKLRR